MRWNSLLRKLRFKLYVHLGNQNNVEAFIPDKPRKCWGTNVMLTPTNIIVKWIFARVLSRVCPENGGNQWTKPPIIANTALIDKTQWKWATTWYISWRTMSNEEFASTMPVRPPTVNKKIKPKAHSMAGDHLIFPPWRAASQLNTFTPVGMARIIVADVKYACVSTSIPTVNIWWAHTIKPRKPMDIIAKIIPI